MQKVIYVAAFAAVTLLTSGCGGGGGGGGTPAGSPEPSPAPPSGLPAAVRIDTGGGSETWAGYPRLAGNGAGKYVVTWNDEHSPQDYLLKAHIWQSVFQDDRWDTATRLTTDKVSSGFVSESVMSASGEIATLWRENGTTQVLVQSEGATLSKDTLPSSVFLGDAEVAPAMRDNVVAIAFENKVDVAPPGSPSSWLEVRRFTLGSGWDTAIPRYPDGTCCAASSWEFHALTQLPDGRWLLVWQSRADFPYPSEGKWKVYYSIGTAGMSWSAATKAFDLEGEHATTAFFKSIQLSASPDGHAWLTWVDNDKRALWAAHFDGTSWAGAEQIFTTSDTINTSPRGLFTAALEGGDLLWVFGTAPSYGAQHTFRAIRGSAGSWPTPTVVAAGGSMIEGFVAFTSNPAGNVALSWYDNTDTVEIARYSMDDPVWRRDSAPMRLRPRDGTSIGLTSAFDAAMDGDGNLMVVWTNTDGELWSRKIPR